MNRQMLDLYLGNFEALKKTVPSFIREGFINEYNDLVDSRSRTTGEDLAPFRILPTEVNHRVIGSRRAAYGRPGSGSVIYSSDKQCDDDLFHRRLQSLDNYLKNQGFSQATGQAPLAP